MPNKSKPKVLVIDGVNEVACDILKTACDVIFEPKLTQDNLEKALLDGIDGLMVRSASQVTAEMIEKSLSLKIVGRAGVGTDNINLKAATKKGVIVVNSPDGNTEAAAEHTMAMIFTLCRHIPQADKIVKAGGWKNSSLTGVELSGKTLGVIGFGKIGQRVASVFQKLGMNVIVSDPFLSQQHAEALQVTPVDLEALYAQADVITLHAPKTPETQHLINATSIAKMKRGVRIVNCARGGIIDEQALIAGIEAGQIAGAALDVFESEPLPATSALINLGDKIILTPHLGASTEEAQINVAEDVAEQIRDYFLHGVAKSAVNIPAFRKEILEPVKAYMPLAEWMGQLIRQISKGGATSLEIVSAGDLAKHNISPVTLAALKGFLGVAREGVNYVNAKVTAEEMDITVLETRSEKANNYTNLLRLNLITDSGEASVAGTLISPNRFHIVELSGYQAMIQPSQYMLVAPHEDKPGMIAQISAVLGAAKINVSGLQVARKSTQAGGQSMMVFNLDDPVPTSALEAIHAIDGIQEPVFLEFS